MQIFEVNKLADSLPQIRRDYRVCAFYRRVGREENK